MHLCVLTGFPQAREKTNPAPGYRNRNTSGALGSVGNSGYSYSSSVNDTNGVDVDFSATHLNSSYAGNRGDSFQLRCLSE